MFDFTQDCTIIPACIGVWCFVISSPDNPDCSFKFCVNVALCTEVVVVTGKVSYVDLKCESVVSPPGFPGENLVSSDGNSLVRSGQRSKKVSSEEKELSVYVNKIFPNPFNGEFTIDFLSTQKSEIEIEVMDILGKSVFLQKAKVEKGKNTLNVALDSDISGGNYFIKISDSQGNFYSEKLMYIK